MTIFTDLSFEKLLSWYESIFGRKSFAFRFSQYSFKLLLSYLSMVQELWDSNTYNFKFSFIRPKICDKLARLNDN